MECLDVRLILESELDAMILGMSLGMFNGMSDGMQWDVRRNGT